MFNKVRSATSDYVGSVSGDWNQIKNTIGSKFGSWGNLSNTFDQRIADGLTDLLTGATGIRTSSIPEISDQVIVAKAANREARQKVLAGLYKPDDNPPESIPLKYPKDFAREDGESGEMTNYIHFRSLKRRATGNDTNEKVYDIFLYVPDTLADSMSVEYSNHEKGILEGAVGALFTDSGANFTWAGNNVMDKAEAAEIFKGGLPGSNILKATAGKTINPLKFQLFNSVSMRTYSYNFEFRPLDHSDSETIQEITYAFRKSMLPGTDGANSRIYTFPNEWAIRYHGNIRQWIDLPMVTVCTKADVDWAPNGFSQHLDGSPTSVKLSLTFTELVTLDRKKFDDRVSGFKHGGDRERENSQGRGSLHDINTQSLGDTIEAIVADRDDAAAQDDE